MSSNTTETVAKTNGASHYFSLLAQNESMNRPQNEDRIRGISVWNCPTCRKNHYLRRDTWLGAQPILADEGI